ncbi:MAG: HD domain-containing protein, partial [Spirochaetaceae bacterium]|nr:HD domain-containing protein [Spirochaetaceae bacterium]
DWRGVVEIDSQTLLDTLRSENRLHVDARNGKELAYSLRADFADPLLTWSDYLIVLLTTLAIGFPLSVGISRKSRFFYETSGLESIIFLFEQTEKDSGNHSRRVAALAIFLGQKMGYKGDKLRNLYTAALLHDIGKIAIPSQILQKTESLTKAELQAIQAHPVVSARILRNFRELASLSPIVLYHHERMDGSGYPEGRIGASIPEESRIIAVVDVFEALIGKRPYRDPVSPIEAFWTMKSMPLDQDIVDLLVEHYKEFAQFRAPKWTVPYVPMSAIR